MFTRDKLDKLKPGIIFASGLDFDNLEGIYLWNTEKLIKWVAVKGHSLNDWAMYADKANKNVEYIKDFGIKLSKEEAEKLIMGTDEFMDSYRR